ncbi:MAG: ATP-binding protein [Longimicrobiales bacterium]
MTLRIHHRLFAGFLGVVGLLVVLIVVLVGRGLRRELTATYQDEVRRQLQLGEWIVGASPGAGLDSLARAITERIGYRVTVIAPGGVVLGDSYLDPDRVAEVDNHAGRPEVLAAQQGDLVFVERRSATVGETLLYGALRVIHDGDPVILRVAAPLTEIEATVDRVQRTIAATGASAMLLALLVAYFLSMALTRPLVQVAEKARGLARGGGEGRLPQTGVAELDDLTQAFNRLTDELAARLGELRRERDEMQALIDCMAEGVVALTDDARLLRTNRAANALLRLPDRVRFAPIGTLVRNPDLRAVLEESVVRAVQAREITVGGRHLLVSSRTLDTGGAVTTLLDVSEVRRLEQVRRDFVANASHELKTPLTTIRGFAEALLEEDPPDHLRERFLTLIRDNTLRLQRLVDDLLDLSRLESGGWMARSARISVADVAEEAWSAYAASAAEKDVEFSMDADVLARADASGLTQILRNLLENALRHTDAGGHVHVRARRDGGDVVVEVSDDGEGIPSRALPRIFERFYRADSSRARDFGGTGLGLAIVRHLVDAMGGTVTAESELGRGTTIRLVLPQDGGP